MYYNIVQDIGFVKQLLTPFVCRFEILFLSVSLVRIAFCAKRLYFPVFTEGIKIIFQNVNQITHVFYGIIR